MKQVAILQSNYIPWKGYFDIIRASDEFVIYDEAQYTKHDWRNRNLIKTQSGPKWMAIPILSKGKLGQRIDEAKVASRTWAKDHWRTLVHNYSRAPFFEQYAATFEQAYNDAANEDRLSPINRGFLELVCKILNIQARLTSSLDYPTSGPATARVVEMCRMAGATSYLSGPNARNYLQEQEFKDAGVELKWMDYSGYPEYPQLFPPFEHQVSVLDLIFNVGPEAPFYIWGWRESPRQGPIPEPQHRA